MTAPSRNLVLGLAVVAMAITGAAMARLPAQKDPLAPLARGTFAPAPMNFFRNASIRSNVSIHRLYSSESCTSSGNTKSS